MEMLERNNIISEVQSSLRGFNFCMCIEMQISDALKSKIHSFNSNTFFGDNPLVLAHLLGIRDGYIYLKYIYLPF